MQTLTPTEKPIRSSCHRQSTRNSTELLLRDFKARLNHPIQCTQIAIDWFLRLGPASSLGAVIIPSRSDPRESSSSISVFAAADAGIRSFVVSMAALETCGVRVSAVSYSRSRPSKRVSQQQGQCRGEPKRAGRVVAAMAAAVLRPGLAASNIVEAF